MNKNIKGLIVVIAIAGLGYLAYKKFGKPNNKQIVIKFLDASYGATDKHKTFVDSADKGYIDSWASAITNGSETFDYNGKTHYTKGGTTKK
jgi:hypothetical protein